MPKRTNTHNDMVRLESTERALVVFQMIIDGSTQKEIARKLGITQAAVSKIKKRHMERASKATLNKAVELKELQTKMYYDLIEVEQLVILEARQAWYRSKTSLLTETKTNGNNEKIGAYAEGKDEIKYYLPDPRLLTEVTRAVNSIAAIMDKINKLWGLADIDIKVNVEFDIKKWEQERTGRIQQVIELPSIYED